MLAPDPFVLAGVTLGSRVLLGTAGYPTQRIMVDAVRASGAEVVTVSIRRVSLAGHGSDTVSLLPGYRLLPNTAGCETARDAVLTAELAREALGTDWIKLEVIGDRETLYPDVTELLPALTLAQRWDLTADEVARNVFAHPTLSEAVKEAVEGIAGHMINL